MPKLKEKRIEKGLKSEELAVKAQISLRHLQFIASGDRKPSLDVAFRIAKALDSSVDDIFLPFECTKCTEEN